MNYGDSNKWSERDWKNLARFSNEIRAEALNTMCAVMVQQMGWSSKRVLAAAKQTIDQLSPIDEDAVKAILETEGLLE